MNNKLIPGISPLRFLYWTIGPTNRARRLGYFQVLAVLALCLFPASLHAQAMGAREQATITFSNGESMTVHTKHQQFRPVGILFGETVNIQLRLPLEWANTPVAVQALDGGFVSEATVVAGDGSAAIAFQAGVRPGLYRVLVSANGRSTMLQFSVGGSKNS
jgi:hypothetical protein